MSSSRTNNVFDLLEAWRQLTLAENRAILAEDWEALELIQAKKSEAEQAIGAADSGSDNAFLSARTKSLAEELLRLEETNRRLLVDKMASVKAELKKLEKTSTSLRNVHRAYGSSGNSFWQAYS